MPAHSSAEPQRPNGMRGRILSTTAGLAAHGSMSDDISIPAASSRGAPNSTLRLAVPKPT